MKWSDEEKEIMKQFYGKIKLVDLRKFLPNRDHIKPSAIHKIAEKMGLKADKSICTKEYESNDHFFDKPDIQNCYWAGFIAADGSITKNKGAIRISLSKKDTIILDHFKSQAGATNPIRFPIKDNYEYCQIQIYNHKWVQQLEKHWNITQNKNYSLECPKPYIENKLALAYLIGFFDGDGCWRHYMINDDNKYSFSFSGTESMMQWLKKEIDNLVPAIGNKKENKPVNIKKYKYNNYWILAYSGKRACKIRETLKQAVNIPWKLARKWDDVAYYKYLKTKKKYQKIAA